MMVEAVQVVDKQIADQLTLQINAQQMDGTNEIAAEIAPIQHRNPPNLVVEIPSENECSLENSVSIDIPQTTSPSSRRLNLSPIRCPTTARENTSSPSSPVKDKSQLKTLFSRLSFRFRATSSENENVTTFASIPRAFSLTQIFTPRESEGSSLPVTPFSRSKTESTHDGNKRVVRFSIHRSRSVPVFDKDQSIKEGHSPSGMFRIIPSTPGPQLKVGQHPSSTAMPSASDSNLSNCLEEKHGVDGGEDILEEEAVCRICFEELGERCETLKMECSCKGELALAHQNCAVKWFTIKGNKICDVCQQEVRNLPVTLLRIQTAQTQGSQPHQTQTQTLRYRVWQEVPILLIVSMLAYFCFLEQLLVKTMNSDAVAISLPLSCILGLLASMASTNMVQERFAWLYSAIQFGLVVLFAHIFNSMLHSAILSIFVATFVGFGVMMCGSCLLNVISRWRRGRTRQAQQQRIAESTMENRSN